MILGLLFRLYNFKLGFSFAHDQDLYSWIAKDILINHHQRLVGQLTSVDGVFIGSFYYYLMAGFYWIFNMNPLSAIVPLTIIGLFNIWGIYWVVNRHFGKKAGFIASIIYAISFGVAKYDRWSVPTLPTLMWSIWFLEVILELLKGNLIWLILYGFLVGFTWQLHIALIPILPLPIIAFFMGNNNINSLWSKSNYKAVLLAILVFGISISPFFIFEIKHNFSQIKSMVVSTQKDIGAPTGKMKLLKVVDAVSKETEDRILNGVELKNVYWFAVSWLVIWGLALFFKKLSRQQGILLALWFLLICGAQFLSKRVVSEYYFSNLIPIYIVMLALILSEFNDCILGTIVIIYLGFNFVWLMTKSEIDQSYLYREEVVNYIKTNAIKNNYPCVALNFIADPGVGVGFRYLFWYNGIKLVKPGTKNVPAYNIPIPWQLSGSENPVHYGRFGVLLPRITKDRITEAECNDPKNQLDPLLGYTE